VIVYLHHSEWGRGNSTGNLVRECLGGELFVSGLKQHEAALAELLERHKGRVAVLWPGAWLTLVHSSAQPEPILAQNTPYTPPDIPKHLLTTPKATPEAPPIPREVLTLS
jgi:hypothetical protein